MGTDAGSFDGGTEFNVDVAGIHIVVWGGGFVVRVGWGVEAVVGTGFNVDVVGIVVVVWDGGFVVRV